MKTIIKKYKIFFVLITIIIFVVLLISYTSPNFVTKKWQESKLNKEFVCPENQTLNDTDNYLYKYSNFYINNYPNMTLSNFLGIRMELLISHKCITTLQNLANDNNGVLPNKDSIKELKNIPYGENNKTLKEL